jgi:hypothetical protein
LLAPAHPDGVASSCTAIENAAKWAAAALITPVHLLLPLTSAAPGSAAAAAVLNGSKRNSSCASHLEVQVFVQVPVLPQVARGEQLCDKVDAVPLLVLPALKALDDVGVLQVKPLCHLTNNLLQLLVTEVVRFRCDLAPRNIDADLRVKGLVDLLEAAPPNNLGVPAHMQQQQRRKQTYSRYTERSGAI